MAKARARLDALAKPLSSLGEFEGIIAKLAGIYATPDVPELRCRALVFCADNGVAAEGVCQSDPSVTRMVAHKIAEGRGNVSAVARSCGADVLAVDVGMLEGASDPPASLQIRKQACGTGSILRGPAMSREQAMRALEAGAELVGEAKAEGYNIVATGEMGIGNTTTSSAVCAALLGLPVCEVTGRGAGLSDGGLSRKIEVIQAAIALNAPDPGDPVDVLSKLGGYDIAAMCGAFLGGLRHGVPVVIDGLISGVSALLAARIEPECPGYMLASHVSREPAGALVLERLGLSPLIHAGMALGEGTGALMLLPMLNAALSVYRQNTSMADLSLAPYERFERSGSSGA